MVIPPNLSAQTEVKREGRHYYQLIKLIIHSLRDIILRENFYAYIYKLCVRKCSDIFLNIYASLVIFSL